MSFPQPSPRPHALVDPSGRLLADPGGGQIGKPGPLGNERLVWALPLADGPRQLTPDRVVVDSFGAAIADPDGDLLGQPALLVARLLDARWSQDSRRLSG